MVEIIPSVPVVQFLCGLLGVETSGTSKIISALFSITILTNVIVVVTGLQHSVYQKGWEDEMNFIENSLFSVSSVFGPYEVGLC